MARRTWCGAVAVGLGAVLVLTASGVVAQTPAADPAAAARAAAKQFRPLTPADVEAAKVELIGAVDRLEARLQAAGPSGDGWRTFVHFDELKAQVSGPKPPDLAAFDRIYTYFAAGHQGLGLMWFADVRQALTHYVGIARGVSDSKLASRYEQLIDGLARSLEAHAKNPTADEATRINSALRWLVNAQQAPQVVEAVEQSLKQPNLHLEVSASTVDAAISSTLDESTPVQDCILGTTIVGTGQTHGELHAQLVPDDTQAVIDSVFCGEANTNNVGYNGPAQICTVGNTQLAGTKRLWINAEGISALPAVSRATTATTITGLSVSSNLGLVLKIAQRKVQQQKGQAEAMASEHAAQRLNGRMDQQGAEMIAKNNQDYNDKFRKLLTERRAFPELHFSTDAQTLHVTALGAEATQVAASVAPPSATAGADLGVRVHESLANNLAATLLSGMTIHDEEFQSAVKDLLGRVPDELKPDPDEEPWAITFADQRPIFLSIGADQFRFTLRGRRYQRGEASYPAMDVTVTYKIVRSGNEVKAVRQGPIEVFPPDFVPGSGAQLSGTQTAIRKMLERRFNKIFKEELLGQEIAPTGELAKIGKLVPTYWASQSGWMSAAWKRVPGEKK